MQPAGRARPTTAFRVALALGIALCLAAAFIASHWIAADTRAFIAQAFNDEQLIIARNARDAVERGFAEIERELLTAAGELESAARGPDAGAGDEMDRTLGRSLARLQVRDVRWLALADTVVGRARVCRRYQPDCRSEPLAELPLAELPDGPLAPGALGMSAPTVEEGGVTLQIATPVRAPAAGLLVCELEVTRFLTPYLRDIRSGKTGYAWIIDDAGRFLYHPVSRFVGRNAFSVREEAFPDVSYERINEIQRERMLRGEEGSSSYDSGQHRGVTGRIEKLIAYTPVAAPSRGGETWSLAVVAPVGDLEDALGRRSRWHLLLGGLAVGLVILAGGVILFLELRWRRILERRVAERTDDLRRSEERYRSLVESSEDAIFTLDAECRIQSANSFSARLFGKRPYEIVGRPFADLLPVEAARDQASRARRVLAGGRSVRGEFALADGGRSRWYSASYMPLRVQKGQAAGVLCIARDVTEQRDLERHLMQTEKLASLGTLAAGFAHEINNPLAVMLGFSELLLKRVEPGTREHDDLKVIERQALHCKDIMENLLSIARTDQETSEHADPDRVVRETIQVVRHSLEMRDVALVEELAVDLPPVRGDFRQLQQVLLNLINNAVAAMPGGGTLHVATARAPDGDVVVRVSDTGGGIAPEHRARVFEPFFTTKPPGEGTGLGLFVSYGIVSKYGGELGCESRCAGEPGGPPGTTMTVRLPVRQEART